MVQGSRKGKAKERYTRIGRRPVGPAIRNAAITHFDPKDGRLLWLATCLG